MMDSMTGSELDSSGNLEESRLVRIARGSGRTVNEVKNKLYKSCENC